MTILRVEGLPEGALDAAAAFHTIWLPRALAQLPPRSGEGDHAQHGGGESPSRESPPPAAAPPPPPRAGEDLVIVFPPATHEHRGWRLAAVQNLARVAAPLRVNGIAANDETAIARTLAFLQDAPGVTGQVLEVGPR
ncbi:hypothetical protein GRI89_12060 [Altererythrobacter salegens]|uniref:Short chain dehydrogenase-like proteobacteria domain-containing protein n=1 Tax=Croceibacterium salegens TaxID=1737568 RepID=A0A6I4T0U4_9SPHN|nr:hypothetical protein [Croceibacterium salegens]MXO60272.1 hypothetical protein [Croceibacterium salegens]